MLSPILMKQRMERENILHDFLLNAKAKYLRNGCYAPDCENSRAEAFIDLYWYRYTCSLCATDSVIRYMKCI